MDPTTIDTPSVEIFSFTVELQAQEVESHFCCNIKALLPGMLLLQTQMPLKHPKVRPTQRGTIYETSLWLSDG